jgi:hypothetical protein
MGNERGTNEHPARPDNAPVSPINRATRIMAKAAGEDASSAQRDEETVVGTPERPTSAPSQTDTTMPLPSRGARAAAILELDPFWAELAGTTSEKRRQSSDPGEGAEATCSARGPTPPG